AELAHFDKMSQQRPSRAAKRLEQFGYQAPVSRGARHKRLEYESVSDLLGPAYDALVLEPVDDRLDGGICRPALFRQPLLFFSYGCLAQPPELFHNLELELRQLYGFLFSHGRPRIPQPPNTYPSLLRTSAMLLQM